MGQRQTNQNSRLKIVVTAGLVTALLIVATYQTPNANAQNRGLGPLGKIIQRILVPQAVDRDEEPDEARKERGSRDRDHIDSRAPQIRNCNRLIVLRWRGSRNNRTGEPPLMSCNECSITTTTRSNAIRMAPGHLSSGWPHRRCCEPLKMFDELISNGTLHWPRHFAKKPGRPAIALD